MGVAYPMFLARLRRWRSRGFRWGLGLRVRLAAIVLIASIPFVFSELNQLKDTLRRDTDAALERLSDKTSALVDRQRDVVDTARSMLTLLAQIPDVRGNHPDRCSLSLATAAAGQPWIQSLAVADASGNLLCSNTGVLVGNVAGQPFFIEAGYKREFVFSGAMKGAASGRVVAVAAYPVFGRDGLDRMLLATVDLVWLARVAENEAARDSREFLLLDDAGTILTRSPDAEKWVGRDMSATPLVKAAVRNEAGTGRFVGVDGVERIYNYRAVPEMQAYVALGARPDDVLAEAFAAHEQAQLQIGVITLTILIAAIFLGEVLLAQPIRGLIEAAERFGHGAFSVRADSGSGAPELRMLAETMNAMADRLANREASLSLQAKIDPLTGLSNRRGFDEALSATCSAGEGRPMALLFLDVDHFKVYNDLLGHSEGDEALKVVAACIAESVREGVDTPARYGGEEFAVICPGADEDTAVRVAERIAAALDARALPHPRRRGATVSVSIGVAAASGTLADPRELVAAADAALYAAKRHGRGRVERHSDLTRHAA